MTLADPTSGVGYAYGQVLPSTHMITIATQQPRALDVVNGGGPYSLGANATVSGGPGWIELEQLRLISGGSSELDNTLTVSATGEVGIDAGGRIRVQNGGSQLIEGGGEIDIDNGADVYLENGATLTGYGGSLIQMNNGAVLRLNTGGALHVTSGAKLSNHPGGDLVNEGVFRMSAADAHFAWRLDNTTLVEPPPPLINTAFDEYHTVSPYAAGPHVINIDTAGPPAPEPGDRIRIRHLVDIVGGPGAGDITLQDTFGMIATTTPAQVDFVPIGHLWSEFSELLVDFFPGKVIDGRKILWLRDIGGEAMVCGETSRQSNLFDKP